MSCTKDSSLTCPEERTGDWKPGNGTTQLTDEDSRNAVSELESKELLFPIRDRHLCDDQLQFQNIGLISFVPCAGAKPNEKGIYGFAKLRGNFSTEDEASKRAEYLIRTSDSYHKIFHTFVGKPFPITESSDFSVEAQNIDIRNEAAKATSTSIRKKRDDEIAQIKEIERREQELKDDVAMEPEDVDPLDRYITLKVKTAQLTWTYLEHLKKMAEVREVLIKAREQTKEMDEKSPEYNKAYFDKYQKAREVSGLETNTDSSENFIRYMVEDVDLPGIDESADNFEGITGIGSVLAQTLQKIQDQDEKDKETKKNADRERMAAFDSQVDEGNPESLK